MLFDFEQSVLLCRLLLGLRGVGLFVWEFGDAQLVEPVAEGHDALGFLLLELGFLLAEVRCPELGLQLGRVLVEDGADELGIKLVTVREEQLEFGTGVLDQVAILVDEDHQIIEISLHD